LDVDIGGTFTANLCLDWNGKLTRVKVGTTSGACGTKGVLGAWNQILKQTGFNTADYWHRHHGTTLATTPSSKQGRKDGVVVTRASAIRSDSLRLVSSSTNLHAEAARWWPRTCASASRSMGRPRQRADPERRGGGARDGAQVKAAGIEAITIGLHARTIATANERRTRDILTAEVCRRV